MAVLTNIDLPDALHDQLRNRAEKSGDSIGSLILRAIEQSYPDTQVDANRLTGPLVQDSGSLGPAFPNDENPDVDEGIPMLYMTIGTCQFKRSAGNSKSVNSVVITPISDYAIKHDLKHYIVCISAAPSTGAPTCKILRSTQCLTVEDETITEVLIEAALRCIKVEFQLDIRDRGESEPTITAVKIPV